LKREIKLSNALAVLIAPLVLLMSFSAGATLAASEPIINTGDAQATVAALIESMRGLGEAKDQAERTQIMRSIDDSLAIESMARQALAQTWLKLTKPQRDEFVELMTKTLEKLAYPRAADFFTGLIVDYRSVSSTAQGEIVRTRATRAQSGQVTIDYLMEQRRGRWRVKDVNLDGASLSESVTNQIQAILKQSSYAELIGKIRARLAEAPSTSQSADPVVLCINCR
jgi:phospholipid transport system substrate-binding protein